MVNWSSIERMIPIAELSDWKHFLRYNKIKNRIRYRGPRTSTYGTVKAHARTFTVYMARWL